MRLPLYQVDAFTDRLFSGNPAAICPLTSWLPDATMQAIAAENNLSETAFFVPEGGDYALRWFTPTVEVDLCGHATLASGYVVMSLLEPQRRSVSFKTLKAGTLTVSRSGDLLVMDFPARPAALTEAPPGLLAALGGAPCQVLRARDHLVVQHRRRGRGVEARSRRTRQGGLLGGHRDGARRERRRFCLAFFRTGAGRTGRPGDRFIAYDTRPLLGQATGQDHT